MTKTQKALLFVGVSESGVAQAFAGRLKKHFGVASEWNRTAGTVSAVIAISQYPSLDSVCSLAREVFRYGVPDGVEVEFDGRYLSLRDLCPPAERPRRWETILSSAADGDAASVRRLCAHFSPGQVAWLGELMKSGASIRAVRWVEGAMANGPTYGDLARSEGVRTKL